jgi:hypothetical protein
VSGEKLYIEGELYLSLDAVAEVYRVHVTWLREAYDVGLFGSSAGDETGACIAAVQLDRVSTIIRLHYVLGLDLEAIQLMLDE